MQNLIYGTVRVCKNYLKKPIYYLSSSSNSRILRKAKATSSPPFHPADLLKLYIYGYLNKVRYSRGLARECIRNVELARQEGPWTISVQQPKSS